MKVAIIPARGGSKRISKKNIKNFAGKPMISYSIMAAKKSKLFDRIIVSTDSEQIAEVSRQLVAGGVSRLIVAGGETSGAVVEGLGLNTMAMGPEIDPGVPAMRASENLVIALKSGNFGAPDFFSKAAKVLAQGAKE